jgi:hypothetical protein
VQDHDAEDHQEPQDFDAVANGGIHAAAPLVSTQGRGAKTAPGHRRSKAQRGRLRRGLVRNGGAVAEGKIVKVFISQPC